MEIVSNPPLFPDLARRRADDAATGADGVAAASADFESFLSLLTAQLRNQDPLQPLDSTQFVAQLASFSTVEQLIGTNERLDGLAAQAEASGGAAYAAWIGREASLTDGRVIADGSEVVIDVPALPGAEEAVLAVVRSDGTVARRIPVDPSAPQTVVWDGKTEDGTIATGEHRLTIGYFAGDSLLEEKAGLVYREIVGLRGATNGVVIDFADGGSARPEEIAALRAPGAAEAEDGGNGIEMGDRDGEGEPDELDLFIRELRDFKAGRG